MTAVRRAAPGVGFALERKRFFAEERDFYTRIRRHYPGYPFEPEVVDDILTLYAAPGATKGAALVRWGVDKPYRDGAGETTGLSVHGPVTLR